MTLYIPQTTYSVVFTSSNPVVELERDFNLSEMAQALLNMETEIHTKKLSDVTHVRVTQTGDVQFVIKPLENVLGGTVFHFTRNNWYSYVTVARPKIEEALRGGFNMSLKYHANTKVVKVLKRENGKYNIHVAHLQSKRNGENRFVCLF